MATIMRVNRIVLTGLLVSTFVVTAKKSEIIANTTRDSWISLEYFASMLSVSFGISKCCNVLITDETAGTESLLNKFIRMYPYEYTLNNTIDHCDSYFVISTSVHKLISAIENVPTRMSMPRLLIIVDDDVEESTELFDASVYGNAHVNIAAHNGIWTLLENYLEPRAFKKVSSYHEMEHERGIANLQGRELIAMAYFNPPLCYLNSTINRKVKGIETEYFIATNESELDGVEVKLFLLIAEQLNFSWTIRNPKKHDRYGHEDGGKWVGGMMGEIIEKRADLAFTSIWMSPEKYKFSNMTQPWTALNIHFLVPRPKPYTSFWALTRPLSPKVWYAMLAMLILESIYVYTRAWVTPKVEKRFHSFAITWTELLGRLMGSCAPKNSKGFELQFQLWHFIGILLVTAYSSSLSERLTNVRYEKRIDTLQDFFAANLSWGVEVELPSFASLFDYSEPYAQQVAARFKQIFRDDNTHKEILKGNFAILGNIIGSNFYPKQIVREDDLAGLRVMKTSIAQFHTSFIVQPWLLQSVNMVTLRIQDAGLIQYHLQDVLRRRTGTKLREVMIEHDGYTKGPRVLKLNPLGAGFAMLAMGLAISLIVFYSELRSAARKRSMREVETEMAS